MSARGPPSHSPKEIGRVLRPGQFPFHAAVVDLALSNRLFSGDLQVASLPKNTALEYAKNFGWPVFPCKPWPDKRPHTDHGFHNASTDPTQIIAWWQRWPRALIGVPTGAPIGLSILDIDPKTGGYDTLADDFNLDWPATPTDHTPSGGAHLWFADPDGLIRNTQGSRGRGLGPGIDWRGTGGYVCVYDWDPHLNFDTVAPLPIPAALLPREPKRSVPSKPVESCDGLSPYARAALDNACRKIIAAPKGEQEGTLHAECFSIGTLAGSNAVPHGFAERTLLWAASRIPNYDSHHPWRGRDLEAKVKRSFASGLTHPREVRRHG